MGSSRPFAPEKSFVAAHRLPYKPDMKIFGGQQGSILSLSGSSEGVLADLGLAMTSSNIDTSSSFNNHSIISKASSMHAHTNPADSKASKKPDKTLPCPRCNSLDTKFCYYNNYNVNQPRHFCKGCQRYWTAGGTLRNVAIGAGRRKRKHGSVESNFQDSAAEDCISCDLSPVKVLGNIESGSRKGELEHGRPQLVKPQIFSLERSPTAAASNPLSLKMKQSSFGEYTHLKQIVVSHDRVLPLQTKQTFKEQASAFYDYFCPKHIEAAPEKARSPCRSQDDACDPVYVEQLKTRNFSLHMDSQQNECSDKGSKLVPTISSDRQASYESGCASSSLTTQAVSVDACVTDGKSDAIYSEVSKEGDEPDRGGSYDNKSLRSAHILPHMVHIDAGKVAMPNVGQCDPAIAPTWMGPSGNSAFKAAWPMISPALTWGPSVVDRALLQESSADAAKAAMIPNVGLLQKHQTESVRPPKKHIWVPKTLRIKDVDDAARSFIWSTLGIKDRQGSVLSEKVEAVLQCHAKADSSTTIQSQHASPAALTQSMAFQESS